MIPYSTDAPIYHLPIGTLLLILANVVCFVVHGTIDSTQHPWVLEFGSAPNPLEWLSMMFAHDGVVHLVSNMYFLAIFGLIVEGKLGWNRFLRLYLSIGLIDAALTQLIMWPAVEGGAVGASSAIMGLMAICLVWAPKNELSVALWFWFRMFLFQISILAYAMFYIVWEVISLMLTQFQMSTPALHLIGFVVGFGVGTLYVKKEWVDCENWDLFAVMAGTHGRFGDETTTVGSHADPSLLFGKDVADAALLVCESPQSRKKTEGKLTQVNQLIDNGDYFEASECLFSLRMGSVTEDLSEPRLRRLAVGLHDGNAVDEAEMFLEEYEDRFDDQSDWCRLRSAQILLKNRNKPTAALKRLKLIRLSRLTKNQQVRARKLVSLAKQQVQSGTKDSPDELDWDHEEPFR